MKLIDFDGLFDEKLTQYMTENKNKHSEKEWEDIMRKCVRCNIAMVENCGIKVKGAAYGLVLTDDENKWWGGRMEQPKVAICPKCGEVSIYLENVDKLKNK